MRATTLSLSVLAHASLAAILLHPGATHAGPPPPHPDLLEVALDDVAQSSPLADGAEAHPSASLRIPVARRALRRAPPAPVPPHPAPALLAAPEAPAAAPVPASDDEADVAIPAGVGDPLDRVLAKLGPEAYGTGGADGPGSGRGDRSSPARLGGPVRWPWPSEADALRVDHATVNVVAEVAANGRATAVQVLDDPDGFGQAARRCAMAHTFVARRDRDGRAVAGSTLPFLVRFDRWASMGQW